MVFEKIVLKGFFYAAVGGIYLLIFMLTCDPRIWGLQDYPKKIKEKVPPQTRREKVIAGLVGIPWLSFIVAYPLFSTYSLKTSQGGEISFGIAFLNLFFMVVLFFLVDLVILDWLIISKITPKFVIIEGTVPEDYKDFSHHYKGHLIASIPLTLFCVICAAIFTFF